MPKIRLTQDLNISTNLSSRLRKRGLLDSNCEPTTDLYLYIQECLARDDSRYPFETNEPQTTVSSMPEEPVNREESAPPMPTKTRFNVSNQKLQERMSQLYNGGTDK